MLAEILLLVLYLALLFTASYCVSEGGEILGSRYDATVVGGFLIAWLNTAPETIFFLSALQAGKVDFAVGAIAGSVNTVMTVACGACIWLGASRRTSGSVFIQRGVRKQAQLLLASLAGVIIFALTGFSIVIAVLGVVEYVLFIIYTMQGQNTGTVDAGGSATAAFAGNGAVLSPSKSFESATDNSGGRSTHHIHHEGDDDEDEQEEHEQPLTKGILFLLVGGILIWLFSEPFISVVSQIGADSGISPLVIAFFCGPIASEAPEILEALSLARKGKSQNINIGISNLVGGTMSKTTLLVSLFCWYGIADGLVFSPMHAKSMLLVVLCAGVAAYVTSFRETLTARWGQGLMGLFVLTGLAQWLISGGSGHSDAVQ